MGHVNPLFRERRQRLLRVRAWQHAMRAGVRTATPVTAGARAGGIEGALPTKVPRRFSQSHVTGKVSKVRAWLEAFHHVLALKT